MADSLYILAVLGLAVAVSEWLGRHTFLRHLGVALLVILVTAVAANGGIVPTFSADVPVYQGIFEYVAPLAIFWLLLEVRLAGVVRAGRTMIVLFLAGSVGTVLGVFAGMYVVGGARAFGERFPALGGMFVGTYVGGSVNFNAIAIEYDVVRSAALYAGANAVDSLMTTVWMGVTLLVPRLVRWRVDAASPAPLASDPDLLEDSETLDPAGLACLLALGCAGVWLSGEAADLARAGWGWQLPSILVLTTLALLLAQFPLIRRLRGARTLGMFAVYLFLAVIGALCDVAALRGIGELAWTLVLFVSVTLLVHGLTIYGTARLLRADPIAASVASQANVGGGTTALALARSFGRGDLVLPGILAGALGNALGTYLGFLAARLLR